jgi:cytochrome oxidase Cu insertion factor (SCO1/SenC/PrrC family)
MKIGPRAKLVLLCSIFALPIVASLVAYRFFRPEPTANYGELLLPPRAIPDHPLAREDGSAFRFAELRDRWALVASDSGACPAACTEKLHAMRQVRLALGRNASRVARVFVVDDLKAPDAAAFAPREELVIALTPTGLAMPPGPANDRAHIYLIDPRGNVMMRWPARPDYRRMMKDLERLLKASQIG